MALEDVEKIGLSFQRLPPEPVRVHQVAPESWAEQMGFRGGHAAGTSSRDQQVYVIYTYRYRMIYTYIIHIYIYISIIYI